MQAKVCVVLLALGLSQVLAMPSPSLQLDHPSTDLMHFLMRSRDLSSDGGHSMDCLGYYIPLINEAVATYEADFKNCLDEASLEVAGINNKTKSEREAIDASATSSCDALKVCSEVEAAEAYFECYSEAGSNNTKAMFTISANASELLAKVQEEVRLIKVNEYVCTNKTQRAYAENTAQVYEDMSLCIAGAPIPSSSPSTEAPSTESSTQSATDSSSASTESSSSAEPESSTDSSSAAPESSTAEPESSTDSSTAEPESSSSAAPESSTDSSSAEPESSTAEPESSSSAAPESSTDSSSAEPESSTDSSSAEPESSTAEPESSSEPESPSESSTPEPESSTAAEPTTEAGEDKQAFPEEDLRSVSGQNKIDIKQILKNLQEWFKTH